MNTIRALHPAVPLAGLPDTHKPLSHSSSICNARADKISANRHTDIFLRYNTENR